MTAVPPPRIFVGLGSNLGNGPQQLLKAWRLIGRIAGIALVRLSSPYASAPVGMDSSNWFTNAVGELSSSLPPEQILQHLLSIETVMGRRRDPLASGYQDRTLDLDLLYAGDMVLSTGVLQVPHPHRLQRLFVLLPLAEIAGDFIDCLEHQSISVLVKRYGQQQDSLPESTCQEIQAGQWPMESA